MSEIYICRHDRLINFCAHCQAELEGYSTTASTGEQTKPRRVVQYFGDKTIHAVTNDGKLFWLYDDFNGGPTEWREIELPPIPQADEVG